MDTKQRNRRPASGSKAAAKKAPPERRRKTGGPDTPDRQARQPKIQRRRKDKAQNPPKQQRVIRPPREEIPEVIYTPPKPLRRGRFIWKLVSMAAVWLRCLWDCRSSSGWTPSRWPVRTNIPPG